MTNVHIGTSTITVASNAAGQRIESVILEQEGFGSVVRVIDKDGNGEPEVKLMEDDKRQELFIGGTWYARAPDSSNAVVDGTAVRQVELREGRWHFVDK